MPEEPSVTEEYTARLAASSPDRTGGAGLSSFQAMTLAGIARGAAEGDSEAQGKLTTVARFLEAAALEGFAGLGIMPRGRRVADLWPELAPEL
jgi:hypothetical protein